MAHAPLNYRVVSLWLKGLEESPLFGLSGALNKSAHFSWVRRLLVSQISLFHSP